jgi:hypothetical protein
MHVRKLRSRSLRPLEISEEQLMGISANPIAIWLATLVGSAAAFGQSSPVLMY